MRLSLRLTPFVLLLVLVAADPPPTMQQIQADFDAQKYQDVVKKVAVALPLSKKPGSEYDMTKLLTLKAESHLRLKQYPLAGDAFNLAAKDVTDEKLQADLKATAILVRRATNGKYQPKQPTTKPADGAKPAKPEPIDIVETEPRKDALRALFNDESKVLLARTETLKRASGLNPLMEGIKQVAELRTLELAGTGTDETCKQILASLGDHANGLMAAAIKTMSENVEKIATLANQTSQQTRDRNDGSHEVQTSKRGLTSVDKNALSEVVATCKQIATACDQFGQATQAGAGVFSGTKGEADRVASRADTVLKADYNPVVTTSGGKVIITRPMPSTRPGGYR